MTAAASPVGDTDTAPVRKGRKVEQVLEGARRVFLRDGYEGASVDDIAREAGVSKATLYSYFREKSALFVAVAGEEFTRQADEAMQIVAMDQRPEIVLKEAAHRIMDFFLSDFGSAVFRTAVAEAGRFPEIGRGFYESGPRLVRDRLGAYLRCATERGELTVTDEGFAAEQFAELCKAGTFVASLLGIRRDIPAAERNRVADEAVAMFMARYGAKT